MSFSSLLSFWRVSWPARWRWNARSPGAFSASSDTATKPFAPFATLRPSAYLFLGSLFLLMAAALSLPSQPEDTNPWVEKLREHHWKSLERVSCPNLEQGKFYELEAATETAELLVLGPGEILLSTSATPEEPYQCREIPQPSFIQEIP